MESLENVLKKIEDLRRDLSAEIVVQEEMESYEEYHTGYKFLYQPRIVEPDTKTRESARQQLQQIYDSTE